MILPPLVASVEGVELLFTPSGRREHAHEVVDLAIVDRGAVSDDLDAEAVEHRQRALAEDAVELLASASHEFVRPQIQHARAGPGRPAHAAPRAELGDRGDQLVQADAAIETDGVLYATSVMVRSVSSSRRRAK